MQIVIPLTLLQWENALSTKEYIHVFPGDMTEKLEKAHGSKLYNPKRRYTRPLKFNLYVNDTVLFTEKIAGIVLGSGHPLLPSEVMTPKQAAKEVRQWGNGQRPASFSPVMQRSYRVTVLRIGLIEPA